MKGNSTLNAGLSNLSMHGLRPALPFGLLPQWLRKLTVPLRSRHLGDALALISKHNPDIICFNEILIERHKDELENTLMRWGFKTITYGVCLHHSPPFQISLVLATKALAEEIPFHITMAACPGGGGGATSLYIPSQNLAILGVHIAFRGAVLDKEIEEINAWIQEQQKLNRKILVIGDFNLRKKEIDQNIPILSEFGATDFITCPPFKTFFYPSRCIDYIFFDKNFLKISTGVEAGLSDHKLVWAELASN
jgi:hypothetical protein